MGLLLSTGKNKKDFVIDVPLLDQSNNPVGQHNPISIMPRYTDSSTAHSKTFSASGDYADSSNHNSSGSGWSYDFKVDMNSSGGAWYNYTYDTNSGRRGSSSTPSHGTSLNDFGSYVSLYADIAVGDGPHPGVGTNYAHIALIHNAAGAYFQYQYTSPPPVNYTHARTWPDTGHHNIKIAGQNYGSHAYRQWFCLADMQSWAANNMNTLRIINWGGGASSKSRIEIHGIKLLIHGMTGANSGADN